MTAILKTENKKIAINSIILYVKLIITIVVSFVSSRLVLQALGASDYGLYNVVGGVVAIFNTLGTTMVATSYRFMAVEIGKGERGSPNRVYNTVFVVHLLLALLLIVLGETLGVFYINEYLNVAPDKISDALFVLHLSLLTTAFIVISIPMNGLIIARESFLFTSVITIVDSFLKLLVVILLFGMDVNKLRVYALFMALIQLITPLAYQLYCLVKERPIIKWNFNKNIKDYKEVLSFAGWILFGSVAVIGKFQGAAVIINYFFGTVLNAAFGLANQVYHAVLQFSSTFRQAFVPQIMKNHESDESRSIQLVYRVSRYSFLAMALLSFPLFLFIDDVLVVWLKEPPGFTKLFIVFMLLEGLVLSLASGFDASIQATGKIKKNQVGYSLINLSLLPIIYILYKIGFPPYANVITMVFLAIGTLVFQIGIMKDVSSFQTSDYWKETLWPCLKVVLVTLLPLLFVRFVAPSYMWFKIVLLCLSIIWTFIAVFGFGLLINERQICMNLVYKIIRKK